MKMIRLLFEIGDSNPGMETSLTYVFRPVKFLIPLLRLLRKPKRANSLTSSKAEDRARKKSLRKRWKFGSFTVLFNFKNVRLIRVKLWKKKFRPWNFAYSVFFKVPPSRMAGRAKVFSEPFCFRENYRSNKKTVKFLNFLTRLFRPKLFWRSFMFWNIFFPLFLPDEDWLKLFFLMLYSIEGFSIQEKIFADNCERS